MFSIPRARSNIGPATRFVTIHGYKLSHKQSINMMSKCNILITRKQLNRRNAEIFNKSYNFGSLE